MAKSMTPVGAVADLICEELGDNNQRHKFRLLQYLALGYQKMHIFLNHTISVKSIVIPTDRDGKARELIIQMPHDFVRETKFGLKRGDRIITLKMNTNSRRSYRKSTDSDVANEIESVLSGDCTLGDSCTYYNLNYGGVYIPALQAFGTGYSNCNYYHMDRGAGTACLQLSTYLPDDEIIIEYISNGLSAGLKLFPSEAFLALYHFAKARFNNEGENGPHQLLFESEYTTLKRLYNFKHPDQLVSLIFD